MNKEHNFVSAVVYLGQNADRNLNFLKMLYSQFEQHFYHYEIIGIIPHKGLEMDNIRAWAKAVEQPVTFLTMSLHQQQEQCMNAGLDISIGDYVYEFDTTEMPYAPELIWDAYVAAIEGHDIVSVCPEKTRSKLFYHVFNRFSHAEYDIRTDVFHLISRRAINRVHAINENLPYRKAAYATCGLKMAYITFCGQVQEKRKSGFDLAVDSLVLYTDFGYRFSIGLTILMLLGTFAELIYTLVIWLTGHPVSGWTTTMFVLTMGMTGLFAILAITLKYLSLLVKIVFQKQNYFVETIEKL